MAEGTHAARAASHGGQPTRPRRPVTAHAADCNRLPAAPVLLAIQRRGRLRRQSLREPLGPELFGAYGNAQATGTIILITLERFCDDVLGWHPRALRQRLRPGHRRVPAMRDRKVCLEGHIRTRLVAAVTSSVRGRTGPPLCGPAFPQVDPDRQG